MYRCGDVQAGGCSENTDIGMWKTVAKNRLPQCFTEADSTGCGILDNVIEETGLCPQTKLSRADIVGNALGGGTDFRQFKVMNGAGSVARHMGDQSTLHQVDDIPRKAHLDNMGTHHQDDGLTRFSCGDYPVDDGGQIRVNKFGHIRCRIQHVAEMHAVSALSQRTEYKSGPVKDRIRHIISFRGFWG